MFAAIQPYLIPLTIGVATIIIFIGQLISGKNDRQAQNNTVSSEVINAYAEQVKQLREKASEEKKSYDLNLKELRKEISDLTLRIGEQNGKIQEKDRVILEYKEIFQNRNPELVDVLKQIKDFMVEIHGKIDLIEIRSEKREKRDLAVDSGHLQGVQALVDTK